MRYEQAKIEGQVKITMTTCRPLTLTQIMDGEKPVPATVETTVCKSDYDTAQLVEMSHAVRQPTNAGGLQGDYAHEDDKGYLSEHEFLAFTDISADVKAMLENEFKNP